MLYMTAFSFFIIIKNKVIKWSEYWWGWGGVWARWRGLFSRWWQAKSSIQDSDHLLLLTIIIIILTAAPPVHTPVLLPPLPLWSPVMTGGRRLNNKKSLLCSTSCQHQSNRPRWIPVMGNNVSGISTLHRGQQQGFHRLRNSQKGELPEHAS